VLADLWQQGDDDARGTLIHAQCEGLELAHELVDRHGERWRRPAIAAGFAAERLGFDRGFAPPLVTSEREPLARSADAFRLSAVLYQPIRPVLAGLRTEVHEAARVTATGIDGSVALKSATTWDRETSSVLERELQILRRFASPRLPKVRDIALARRGGIALVLEWRGTNLATILTAARTAKRIPGEAVAIAIGIQLCEALAAAHSAKVVHGELAPDHVMVQAGQVTLCDFGYATCDLKLPASPISPAGQVRARFGYLSPEQTRGEPIDPTTDVFALGLLVAELVALQHPVGAQGSDYEKLVAIRELAFTLPTTRSTLATKLRAFLVRDRAARPSAAVLGLELARIAETAHLRTGPEVVADFTRGLGL
jgi:serine/threonine-protein kinase